MAIAVRLLHSRAPSAGGALTFVRQPAERRIAAYLLQVGALALVYALFARLGLQLAFANRNVTAVWPPTGIALSGLLILGRRVWPGVALGALMANLLNGASVETAALISVGNTLAPLAAAF